MDVKYKNKFSEKIIKFFDALASASSEPLAVVEKEITGCRHVLCTW